MGEVCLIGKIGIFLGKRQKKSEGKYNFTREIMVKMDRFDKITNRIHLKKQDNIFLNS